MDTLHTVLRAITPERKSAPDHLTVFREFLARLDSIQHKAPARPISPKSARAKPTRRKAKRNRAG